MIRQIHLDVCDSTQDELKEQLKETGSGETILVSCNHQSAGRGRGENQWTAMEGTLCLSMNIAPHTVMSYTAIELAVLVVKFFETKRRKLKVKWPNDLWDEEGKKCGGILVQGLQAHYLAGIGLNLFSTDARFGSIFSEKPSSDKKAWAKEIAEYIESNRFRDTKDLRKDWLLRCGHLNEMVTVTEGSERYEGIFQGLGEYGEAMICCDGQTKRIYNGSLRLSGPDHQGSCY